MSEHYYFGMGLFGSKTPKAPQMRIVKQGKGTRVLDFTEFMNQEMKLRIKQGVLEWMDKVDIFESFYMPTREAEGWVLNKGNYKSDNTGDRFKVEWQVGEDVIIAKYDDYEFTVTERLKIRK